MDDVPEKVRRNLMVVSTAIILLWFLRVPIQGKIFWVLDLTQVDTWRPWSAALAILVYCMLRFHTEPDTTKSRERAAKNIQHQHRSAIQTQLHRHALHAFENNVTSRVLGQLTPPEDGYELVSVNALRDQGGGALPTSSRYISFEWKKTNEKGGWTKHTNSEFSLRWYDHLLALPRTLKYGKWFKWDALELGLPYLLSVIAGVVCAWQIWSAIKA